MRDCSNRWKNRWKNVRHVKIFVHVTQNSFFSLFKIVSKNKVLHYLLSPEGFSNMKQKEKQEENSFSIRALSLLYLRKARKYKLFTFFLFKASSYSLFISGLFKT
jgi:hypothetical protein